MGIRRKDISAYSDTNAEILARVKERYPSFNPENLLSRLPDDEIRIYGAVGGNDIGRPREQWRLEAYQRVCGLIANGESAAVACRNVYPDYESVNIDRDSFFTGFYRYLKQDIRRAFLEAILENDAYWVIQFYKNLTPDAKRSLRGLR